MGTGSHIREIQASKKTTSKDSLIPTKIIVYAIAVSTVITVQHRAIALLHYGRGEGGIRVYDDRPGNKGKNITLIGAMTDEGLIATMTFCGSLNSDSFLVFIEQILLPQLWIGAIVVMDNLSVPHYPQEKYYVP